MWNHRNYTRTLYSLLVGVICIGCLSSAPIKLFYPYGTSRGDQSLTRGDDVSSKEFQLTVPIHFYDGFYTSVYVNSNGHLSFGSDMPGFQPNLVLPLPDDIPIQLISAFMADIDLTRGGDVFFRESEAEPILQRVAADVQAHFSQFPNFEPLGLFIATWDGVGAYGIAKDDDDPMTNTFQIVVASDQLNSFVIFNYLDDGIKWTKSYGKLAGRVDDPPAQAGFNSGTGRRHLKLPHSGTNTVSLLNSESNVNLPGVWMFHIGNLKGGNVQSPDLNTGDVVIFEPEIGIQTCLEGSRTCHENSQCLDFPDGFCCECVPPTYGNGKHCIQPEQPQRLNGKVSGMLNNVQLDNVDMHAFVVTKDGRAYTAVSRVPSGISSELMTLNTIGGVIGWMFAKPGGPGAMNGYMFTGGSFNRTAIITYQNGGKVTLSQRFYGHDALNNVRLDTYINGTIPAIEATEKITVDDYSEDYRRVSPGVIRSQSDRTFRIDNVARKYNWDQTITYDECMNDPTHPGTDTMRLGVTRNYVIYDTGDATVRFAMSNKISVMSGFDPCQEGANTCDQYAECIPSGNSFRCECRTGFSGDGNTCEDVDECAIGLNTCDENALCYNTPGSFQCQCQHGFRGDGRTCIRDQVLCGGAVCDENSRCVFNDVEQKPMCECRPGYTATSPGNCVETVTLEDLCGGVVCDANSRCVFSAVEQKSVCECRPGFTATSPGNCVPDLCDGVVCDANSRCVFSAVEQKSVCECRPGFTATSPGNCVPEFDCNEADICDENAECMMNPYTRRYECECVEGFSGDGMNCRREAVVLCTDKCDPHAECVLDVNRFTYRCLCMQGYSGDGKYCTPIDTTIVSTTCQSCDVNADCLTDRDGYEYCACATGYRGDGYRCVASDCRTGDVCDVNAQCRLDSQGNYYCRCNPGYSGNGNTCQPEGCDMLNNCDVNAECIADPRDTSRYICRCMAGYSGDGFVCIRRVPPCSQVDNCSEFGECVYDPQTSDHRCRCHRGYTGDGMTCTPRGIDCRRDPRLCDPNASCILNVDTFMCTCNANYRGDGQTCTAVSDEMNYLLFSRGYSIHKVSYTQNGLDTDGSRVLYVPGELAVGIAADCSDQTFYWTDVSGGKISRATQDGFNKETVVNGFSSPEGVAVDWLSRNLYVTDSGLDTVAAVTINGTYKKTLISEDLENPRGIVLDPQRGVMYWTDWFRNNPTIETANMDGSDRKVFVESDLGLPNGLTMDYYTQQICWGDAGLNRIECIRSDGVGRRIVTEDAPYPFDLSMYGNTIYWSDWTMSGVPSVDRNGGDVLDALKLPIGGNGRTYGMAAVGEFCPRVSNACYRSYNGGCRYLCLPTPNGGRTCACPDDIDDETCADIGHNNK